MLTDSQLKEMAPRMGIPLEWCGFKNTLPKKLRTNKAYIVNLDSSEDLDGDNNSGTHWTCFQVMEYPNGKKEAIYFDPFGAPPPEIVKSHVKSSFGIGYIPHTTKDVQSLMANVCGWYCLAMLHFINESPYRSRSLYDDVETFLSLFDDLNETVDWKKNEYVLKHFFLAKDPALRKAVEIGGGEEAFNDVGGQDKVGLPVDVKLAK